jgi:hypothetical protein
MKTLSEIRLELSTVLRQCEDYRLEKLAKYRNGILFTAIVAVLAILSFGISFFSTIPSLYNILGYVFLAGTIIVYIFTVSKHLESYKNHFKSNILKNFIENLMPTVSYDGKGFIDRSDFNSANLFSSNYNKYKGEDYFKGIHNGISFEMCELDISRRTSSGSRNNTTTTNIFNGIFIIITASKSSLGETYILPDTAEKTFGNFGVFIQKNIGYIVQRGSMIYFDQYPEFEKSFVVYSTEETASQSLLSENMIQSILDIYKRWNIIPSFAFIDNKVYIAIPYSNDILKVSLHKSLIDNQEEILQKFIDEIALSMSVIEELSEQLK